MDLGNNYPIITGFGTVYMGLEQAGIALAKSLTNETVTVVKHK